MFGKFDGLDRLVQVVLGIAALFALANGVFMLVAPISWYDFVDTVKASGPPNGHFIQDIGIAFLVSGGVLAYAAINPVMRWGSAVVGNLFPTFHGVLHIYEVVTGICSPDIFWRDAPGVLGPAIAVWIALGIQIGRQRISYAPLPKSLFLKFARRSAAPAEKVCAENVPFVGADTAPVNSASKVGADPTPNPAVPPAKPILSGRQPTATPSS